MSGVGSTGEQRERARMISDASLWDANEARNRRIQMAVRRELRAVRDEERHQVVLGTLGARLDYLLVKGLIRRDLADLRCLVLTDAGERAAS